MVTGHPLQSLTRNRPVQLEVKITKISTSPVNFSQWRVNLQHFQVSWSLQSWPQCVPSHESPAPLLWLSIAIISPAGDKLRICLPSIALRWKNVGVVKPRSGSRFALWRKNELIKNKERVIGPIVKLVIVWSWWVVMRTVLHQWIYKRCNFEIWKDLGKKHGGTANCFIIRRPRIVWISMFCCCWRWKQEKMKIPWLVKAAWVFVHRCWALLQIWDGTFIRILSQKDKQANWIEEMLAPLKMWEVVGLLVSGWCWLVSVGLYNSLYSGTAAR